jgi:hypothetical protein
MNPVNKPCGAFVIFCNTCSGTIYKPFCPLLTLQIRLKRSFLTLGQIIKHKGRTAKWKKQHWNIWVCHKTTGAYACRIFQYNSVVDTSATWQAIMYRGDDITKPWDLMKIFLDWWRRACEMDWQKFDWIRGRMKKQKKNEIYCQYT